MVGDYIRGAKTPSRCAPPPWTEHPAEARDHDTWNKAMAGALAPPGSQIIQSTSDEDPGLLAYVEHHLGVHHSPDIFHVQQELSKAVAAPMAAKQQAAAQATAQAEEMLTRPHRHHPPHRPAERLSQACLERIAKAERVVPKVQATIEFVSGYVRQQGRQLDLAPPVSYAMHTHLIPSYYLDRVASTRTVTAGAPLRARAECLRTPLFEPGP
jgi:hypothetical protein